MRYQFVLATRQKARFLSRMELQLRFASSAVLGQLICQRRDVGSDDFRTKLDSFRRLILGNMQESGFAKLRRVIQLQLC